MHDPTNPSQFLRRKDKRRSVQLSAIAQCHGISRAIEIVDFSNAGLRIDKVKGLAAGDHVRISFTPDISVEGTIAWLVWHKAGLQFTQALKQDDPAYRFLLERAAFIEQAHVRAIGSLAQRDVQKLLETDLTVVSTQNEVSDRLRN